MIANYFCPNCEHYAVCGNVPHLAKFSLEAKKNLGIDITLNSCEYYDGPEDEADEG